MKGARLPFHLLAKPTGATCNIDCKYCFFLSKEKLYPNDRSRMSDEVLEAYVRQRLESAGDEEVAIAWQGGEPTMMGLGFFRRAMVFVERYARRGQRITHTIQTNGLAVDDAWCAFFKEHGFLVGLSMDGPADMHDAYRVDRRGGGTHHLVRRAWDCLVRHGIETNILCSVHAANVHRPLELYRYFRDELGARYLQFIPIVERTTAELLPVANQGWGDRPGGERPLYLQQGNLVTERTVPAEAFGAFLCGIFDEWVARDVGTVFVQTFDVALGSWLGQHSLCIFSPECGTALALEHNGDLYSCDHYVEPEYLLGNILAEPMAAMVGSPAQKAFGRAKSETLPDYCRRCEVRFACHGECPRNRFITTPDGEPGLNYLCAGYRRFFNHIDAPMNTMASLLRQGRFADEIMVPARERAEA